MSTYNKTNIFDFSNPHIDLLALINRQTDVEKIVLMGHAANLHEGQKVTLIVTSLILKGLEKKKQQHTASGLRNVHLKIIDTSNAFNIKGTAYRLNAAPKIIMV